jgi:hypothetical protein
MKLSLKFCLLFALLAGAAFASDLPLKPMSPKEKAAAREKVLRAVTAKEQGSLEGLLAEAVTCGPRLWALIKPEMAADADVVLTYFLVEKSLAGRMGLQAVDLAAVSQEKKESVTWLIQDGAKFGRVVVESGIFRHQARARLSEFVGRSFLKAGEKDVRDPSPLELQFFRELVPYHHNEPVFTVISNGKALLMDFDTDVKTVWIEWMPEAAPPRAGSQGAAILDHPGDKVAGESATGR